MHLFLNVKANCLSNAKFQTPRGTKDVIYKKIQGGNKHDITLRLRNKCPWEVATLTLHLWGKPEEKLPFRVETCRGSKEWVEGTAFEIHSETWPYTYTRVRVRFCRTYFQERIQFSMKVNDRRGHTNVAIVVVKNKPVLKNNTKP